MQHSRGKIIFNIAKTYQEAEDFDIKSQLAMTPEERLDLLQSLREDEFLFDYESRRRLRTIHKVIKRKIC